MSRKHNVDESVSAEESDSGEKMSTTDSHNWSDDDSKDELEQKSNDESDENEEDSEASGSETDEENGDEDKFSLNADNGHKTHHGKKGKQKRAGKRKRLHQSDTETRKLLDDVGDVDEEYAYLDEAKENEQIDPRFFEMSDEQLNYYTKCFLHLQQKTQGQASLNGAVSGADTQVLNFFRKSQLDTRTLSRVWALADINEDGFLNHSEFMLAMHLIVLHVKGNVPVPSRLPSPVRPCITPNRLLQPVANELQNSTASSTLSSTADNASTSRGSEPQQQSNVNQHFHYFQPQNQQQSANSGNQHLQANAFSYSNEETNPKHHSLSDDHLHVHAQREAIVANFSDAPPVLVDSRPTALNATTNSTGFALLNSLATRGPPPKPPPRQYDTTKGHGRSASLDLNTLAAVTGQLQKPNPSMYHSATNQPSNATTMSVDGSLSASAFTTSNQFFSQTPPAPPLRPQQKLPELHCKGTQTDPDDAARQPLLDENTFAALLEGAEKMSPAERCRVLRLYNSELENERATLAQIRLQLQLRLEEAEQALKNHGVQVEPIDTSNLNQPKGSMVSPKPTTV